MDCLRKGIEVLQSKTATERGQGHRRLFVAIEEYKTIQPTDMHQGECVVVDQGLVKGGTSGAEAILALRTMDGAWPDETADLVSENIVLGAIKAVQNITYGMKALLDQTNYLERGGRIVHIQEAYADFAFGGLRVERALDADALREKADDVRNSIVALCARMQHPNMSELITALRLQDTNDRKYLCLWYLRLWEAACAAGAQFGDTQFGNPEGARDGRGRRREQLDHRNDIAHGRTDEIDYRIFDYLQTDIQNSLRKNVFR